MSTASDEKGNSSVFKSANSITMQALRAAIEARVPTMLVGAPGVGKTATIRAMAESMGYDLVTLIGSRMDPSDIVGLPKGEVVAHSDDGSDIWGTVYLAPWWQVRVLKKRKVILFFDEWTNTPSAVRASMLSFMQDREFADGTPVPSETIILGAMNPVGDAADGWDLDKPTTNRILFLAWKSSNSEWFEGMLKAWGKKVPAEEMFWRRKIVAFLEDNPSYIHKENDGDVAGGSPEVLNVPNDPSQLEILRYAWASPRSWDNLSRVLSHVNRNDVNIQDEIASGLVGRSSAMAFRNWMLEHGTLTPEEVLDDAPNIDWNSMEVSEANIVFRGVVKIIDETNWKKALRLLDAVGKANCQALIGSYLTDILKAIARGADKQGDKEERRRSQQATLQILEKYYSRIGAKA